MNEEVLVIRRKRRGDTDKFASTVMSVDWRKAVGLSSWAGVGVGRWEAGRAHLKFVVIN